MKVKQVIALCIIIILVGFFTACSKGTQEPSGIKKLKVTTTLFPVYDMAKKIGMDKADISLLLPPGVEAH
ncbi:MAG: hypothetical protein HXY53_08265 [Nitrospirae bacterium]|nr:hypothetical protein [Nitrospirota bacterium]